jgi:putative membrane protein
MSGDLDPRDYSRRTLLANERTFLAWWRTGLTAMTAGIAVAQLVPKLAETSHRWPYSAIGVAFALVGATCMAYGQWRRVTVARAIRAGEFAEPSAVLTLVISAIGVAVGIAVAILILTTS